MHQIEPFYQWRDFYTAEDDKFSPFFKRQYDEFNYTNAIYNYLIHPQWDYFGSDTLFVKILYANYDEKFAIIEILGEWNDCIGNDIMFLKRDVLDVLINRGINKFILIAENILNFHFDMDDYYAELLEDIEDGWAVVIGLQQHVRTEFEKYRIYNYLFFNDLLNDVPWRTFTPMHLFAEIEALLLKSTNQLLK